MQRLRVGKELLSEKSAQAQLGFGFPTGMRLVNAIDPRLTPWFWAINGAAGVLAASVAVAANIAFSINVSIWLGAACYVSIGLAAVTLMSSGTIFA
jgi:hypothetical protein